MKKDAEQSKPLKILERGRYARMFRGKSWYVYLDPDLVELLSGEGSASDHVYEYASRRSRRRPRMVEVLLLTDAQLKNARPMLERIGARIGAIPAHPNAKLSPRDAKPRRKAG
jgi:hypothetical protein